MEKRLTFVYIKWRTLENNNVTAGTYLTTGASLLIIQSNDNNKLINKDA